MAYFAQTLAFSGKPRSQTTPERPPDKRPEGGKVKWYREPVKVAPEHEKWPLRALENVYGRREA